MKKFLLLSISIVLLFDARTIFANDIFIDNNFDHIQINDIYTRLDSSISRQYLEYYKRLSISQKEAFSSQLTDILSGFKLLDTKLNSKDKLEIKNLVSNIKFNITSLINVLKSGKETNVIQPVQIILPKESSELNKFSGNEKFGEIMYYSDSFEGKNTSNGNLFKQRFFSTAKCDVPLNNFIQVWLGNKSLLVKVNDRPNCTRFPNLIDLTTTAFDFFFDRYEGKQNGSFLELGDAPKDYYKMYIPTDSFSDESIILADKLPNTYLLNESMHINGELSLQNKLVTLDLLTPSGKKISLKKQIDKYFSFSYPLEERGIYELTFNNSPEKIKIYILESKAYEGKKFIKSDIEKISNLEIIKDKLGNDVEAYRILLKDNNFHMATLTDGNMTYSYSGNKDIIIPLYVLESFDKGKEIKITIKASKTLTGFSHDFYIEPVVIFDGMYRIGGDN